MSEKIETKEIMDTRHKAICQRLDKLIELLEQFLPRRRGALESLIDYTVAVLGEDEIKRILEKRDKDE